MPTILREEVFSQLRQLADLCNSLPRPPGTRAPTSCSPSFILATRDPPPVAAEPALRSSGVYDFTPPSASPRDAARTRGSRARAEKQEVASSLAGWVSYRTVLYTVILYLLDSVQL